VDLAPWRGQDIEVALVTRGGASADWDWAGWGDLRLEGARPVPDPARQYALVYDGELRVYRNHHAWPRAFVVHAAESVTDAAAALRRIGQLDFDPATRVVVEGLPAGALPAPDAAAADGPVPAAVLVYEDARVVVRTRSARPGMLVLTDVFYPGWTASVDGAPAPLYAADYAFRGVPVAAGEHTVEFRYRPRSFTGGAMVSAASLLALAGLGWRTGKGGA
jgi:hypothetical protein